MSIRRGKSSDGPSPSTTGAPLFPRASHKFVEDLKAALATEEDANTSEILIINSSIGKLWAEKEKEDKVPPIFQDAQEFVGRVQFYFIHFILMHQILHQGNSLKSNRTLRNLFLFSNVQVGNGRKKLFQGVLSSCNVRPSIDLLIADIPENLPVPTVSNPSSLIPPWNVRKKALLEPEDGETSEDFMQDLFDHADSYIHDDGALLLFYPDDQTLRREIAGYVERDGFKLFKEWWGINRLRLALPNNPTRTVSFPLISVY